MSENLPIRKKYNLLNAFRLIASFFIVAIHIHFPGNFGTAVIDIARFAVPFFFMASGFFSYYKDSPDTLRKITNKIKNVSIIYIGATALYGAYKLLATGTLIKRVFSVMSIAEFVLFNQPKSSEHLWFLPALVYTYIIFYFFEKFKITKKMYFLIPLLFVAGVAIKEIFIIFGYPLETLKNGYICRNFLFLGLPFFMLGHYIRANEDKLKSKSSNFILIAGFILGSAEAVAVGYLHSQKSVYLGSFIAVFALFIFIIKNEDNIKMSFVSTLGEKYSLYIYILHIFVRDAINKAGELIPLIADFAEKLAPVMPIIIFVITLCASAVYVFIKTKLKEKINLKKAS